MKYFLRILCLVGVHSWQKILGGKVRVCSRCFKMQKLDGRKWRKWGSK